MSVAISDLFTPATASTLVLFAFRVGGLLLIAPVFASKTVALMPRVAMLVVLSWVMFPVALSSASAGARITPETALYETLIGFALGLGAAVFVGAMEAMGDLLAIQIGLSAATTLDPLTNQSIPVLGQFANLFAIALLLSVDAHVVMLEALAASTRLLPVGAPIFAAAGLREMLDMGSLLFLLGIRFAAPIVAVVLLGNVALAVLSRAAPQLNVLSVAFPLQIGLGLLALVASIPLIGGFFLQWPAAYEAVLVETLDALSGGGR